MQKLIQMNGNKQRKAIILLALIQLFAIDNIIAQTSKFIHKPVPAELQQKVLKNPFVGGLNNPQFSEVDLDLDGSLDLFVFDRSGNVSLTFLYENGTYNYAPQYQDIFPELHEWVLLRDYNNDGLMDIFASSYALGPQGVEVYKGIQVGGRLQFTRRTFAGRPNTMLNIPAGSNTTHLPVDYIDIPNISDIDGDGDLDILSFGPNSGYMNWYRNMASENGWPLDSLRFRLEDYCWGNFFESGFSSEITLSDTPGECASFKQNKLEPRHAGSTVLAKDLDGNGLDDLLIGDIGSSNIVALFNNGTQSEAFVSQQDVEFPNYDRPVEIPIFPATFLIDTDGDGDKDLIVSPNSLYSSENKNTSWLYENIGTEETPQYSFVSDTYFSEEILDFGIASAPAFVDYNNDGLMDIVVGTGGYYVPGGIYDARLFLLENIGTSDNPRYKLIDEDFLGLRKFSNSQQGSYFFTPTFGDLDNDGDLDVVVGEIYGKLFYGENTAAPGQAIRVENWTYAYMDINTKSYSAPFLFDLNGDGLLDLIIGARQGNNDPNDNACSNFYYFENIGSASNAQFDSNPDAFPNTRCLGNAFFRTLSVSPFTSPIIKVIEQDTVLIAGNDEGELRAFNQLNENIYSDFNKISDDFGQVNSGSRLRCDFADIDGDEKYEVVCGNFRGGLQVYDTELLAKKVSSTFMPKAQNFEIYPNPIAQASYISLLNSTGTYDLDRVSISSSNGMVLYDQDGSAISDGIPINLAPGLYFVRIEYGLGMVEVHKLVVTGQ